MTIQEEKKKAIADIESDQEKLLAEIISISKKLEKKNVKAAMASAIDIVTLGIQIKMLEAQKQVIMSQPMPKYPLETPREMGIVRDDSKREFVVHGSEGEIEMRTKVFEMDILILKNRYGGLHPREEESMRAIFKAKIEALKLSTSRKVDQAPSP